jgi:hypothetical protein
MHEAEQTTPSIPAWATEPISRFVDQSDRLSHVVRLSVEGISGLTGAPALLAALAEANLDDAGPAYKRRLPAAEADAALAAREIEAGFPLLFSIAAVAEWSLLEELVRSVVKAWLRNSEDISRIEPIAKLKVRLGEYQRLSPDDRFGYIVELLEAETAAGVRNGIDRFESVLKPIGLGGMVPSQLRRDMFEFGQVRNAIVHRGSTTDRQLSEACPWLNLVPGQELEISQQHFGRYLTAAHQYAIVLLCRLGEQFSVDMSTYKDNVFTKYGERSGRDAPEQSNDMGNTTA